MDWIYRSHRHETRVRPRMHWDDLGNLRLSRSVISAHKRVPGGGDKKWSFDEILRNGDHTSRTVSQVICTFVEKSFVQISGANFLNTVTQPNSLLTNHTDLFSSKTNAIVENVGWGCVWRPCCRYQHVADCRARRRRVAHRRRRSRRCHRLPRPVSVTPNRQKRVLPTLHWQQTGSLSSSRSFFRVVWRRSKRVLTLQNGSCSITQLIPRSKVTKSYRVISLEPFSQSKIYRDCLTKTRQENQLELLNFSAGGEGPRGRRLRLRPRRRRRRTSTSETSSTSSRSTSGIPAASPHPRPWPRCRTTTPTSACAPASPALFGQGWPPSTPGPGYPSGPGTPPPPPGATPPGAPPPGPAAPPAPGAPPRGASARGEAPVAPCRPRPTAWMTPVYPEEYRVSCPPFGRRSPRLRFLLSLRWSPRLKSGLPVRCGTRLSVVGP